MAKWQNKIRTSLIIFVILLFLSLGLWYAIKYKLIKLSHLDVISDQSYEYIGRILNITGIITLIFGIVSFIYCKIRGVIKPPDPEKLPATKQDIKEIINAIVKQTSPQQISQGETHEIEPSSETKQNAQSLLDLLQQLKESGQEIPTSVQLSEGIADIGLGNYEQGEEKIRDYLEKMDDAWNHVKSIRDENLVLGYRSLGNAAYNQAKYKEAEDWYKKALQLRPSDPEILNKLGTICYYLGKYDDGVQYIGATITEIKKTKDTDNVFHATLLNNLAELYKSQGLYDQAEPLYEKALEIGEKSLGTDHPEYATWLNNLAGLYHAQGLYNKAEPLFKRALEIGEKTLGPDHPSVAIRLNNLAGLYDNQGLYDKAEPLYKRALEIWEKAPGPEHPKVAGVLNNMAWLYDNMGDKEKAAEYGARAKAIRDKRGE